MPPFPWNSNAPAWPLFSAHPLPATSGTLPWEPDFPKEKQTAYLRETNKKAGEGLLTRLCRDRLKGDGFELKESRLRVDIKKKFFTVGIAQRRVMPYPWKCSRPRGLQAKWSVEGVPAHGEEAGTRSSFMSLPTQTNLCFHGEQKHSYSLFEGVVLSC